jgi:hypothetical protein
MKMFGGMEVQLHAFLTLVLGGGEWSASHPSHFTPRESTPYQLQFCMHFLSVPICYMPPPNLIPLHLITLIIFNEEYKL